MVYGNNLCLVRQSQATDKYTTWPKFSFINIKALGRKLAIRILMVENAEKHKCSSKRAEGVLEVALSCKDLCKVCVFRNVGTLS